MPTANELLTRTAEFVRLAERIESVDALAHALQRVLSGFDYWIFLHDFARDTRLASPALDYPAAHDAFEECALTRDVTRVEVLMSEFLGARVDFGGEPVGALFAEPKVGFGAIDVLRSVVERDVTRINSTGVTGARSIEPGRATAKLYDRQFRELEATLSEMEPSPNDLRQASRISRLRRLSSALVASLDKARTHDALEASMLSVRETEFSLADELERVVSDVANRLAPPGLKVGWLASPQLPERVRSDAELFCKVVEMLTENAIENTLSGTVVVRAAQHARRSDEVVVRLTVEDTGVGLLPSEIQRVVQPFVRAADLTRQGGSWGIGLGLSNAIGISELLGGQLAIESDDGGTTVVVTLPMQVAEVSSHAETGIMVPPESRAVGLVASAAFRESLRSLLTTFGMQLDTVNTPDQMRQMLRTPGINYRIAFVERTSDSAAQDVIDEINRSPALGFPAVVALYDRPGKKPLSGAHGALVAPFRRAELEPILLEVVLGEHHDEISSLPSVVVTQEFEASEAGDIIDELIGRSGGKVETRRLLSAYVDHAGRQLETLRYGLLVDGEAERLVHDMERTCASFGLTETSKKIKQLGSKSMSADDAAEIKHVLEREVDDLLDRIGFVEP